MVRRVFVVSDLTGELIPDEEHVSIKVLDHPTISGAVRLDASEGEIAELGATASDFVVLEVLRQSGTERLVVELDKFEKLFTHDVQDALQEAEPIAEESAPRRRGRPRGSSNRVAAPQPARRDKEQLEAIRTWARENGYEVSNRGRIKAEIEQAYNEAHA
jgi:hypothetical protein